MLCRVKGAWGSQALWLWDLNVYFREMFVSGASAHWGKTKHPSLFTAGPKLCRKLESSLAHGRRIQGLFVYYCSSDVGWTFVLVIYCCVINHPKASWLKTKIILLSLMFPFDQNFGKGSAWWFWLRGGHAVSVGHTVLDQEE